MAAQASASVRRPPLPRSRQVLLVVDFINPLDFPEANKLLPHAWRAAKAAAGLKRRLAARNVPVIYANDNYGVWQSEFNDVLAKCLALDGLRGQIAQLMASRAKT